MTRKRQLISPGQVVAMATAVYALLFFALGADRYATFHSGADIGLFVQTIASAFHGFHNTIEGTSHFAYHFSPVLYLCAPLLWITHSALALVAVQSVATALIAPALYAIARKRGSDRNAATVACIALLYPPLQGVTFTDFHETAFMPAAIAWLLWALDARRFAIAAVLLAVVLSIKEDQAPAMAFLGLLGCVYFAKRGERSGTIFSGVTIAVSALVFAGYFAVVRPLAGASGTWVPSHFYAWNRLVHPMPPSQQILGRLTYLLEVFVPLAFIPFRSPVVLLAVPGLLEVLASREPLMYTMGQYYAAVWLPYVLVAFALAGVKLLAAAPRQRRWVNASALLCVLTLVFFSPLHLGHYLRLPDARDAATNQLIARIPPNASVGSYDEIYAHLGFFPNAQLGLRGEPRFVLADDAYRSVAWDRVMRPRLRRELERGVYRVAARTDGITLFERKRRP